MEQYNYEALIGKIRPFLLEKNFKEKRKNKIFVKKNDKVEYYLQFRSWRGVVIEVDVAVTWKKVHDYFINKANGNAWHTIDFSLDNIKGEESPWYNSKEKQEHAILVIQSMYEKYVIPFIERTSTIQGVIENLRANYSPDVTNIRGDATQGLLGYHDSYYELFLTRLVYPEQFEERINYYKETMNGKIQYLIDNRYTDPDIDSREDVSYRFAEIEEEYNGYKEKLLSLDIEKVRLELEIQV